MPKLKTLIVTTVLALWIAPTSLHAQCTSQQGFITVTLQSVDSGLFQYQWVVTNDENGNGNRLTDVFFEIDTADTSSTSTIAASWTKTKEMVEATWMSLHFTHASGPAICSGGGQCAQNTETYNFALNQLVSSVRVRTIQANGQTEDFTNFSSSQPGCEFLPIELASFDATVDGNNVVLSWTTASEENSAGFEVEYRRSDRFEAIGFVSAAGSSDALREYLFRHTPTGPAIGSYRLRMVDLDGTFEYSPVVEIAAIIDGGYYLSQGYPNPFNPTTTLELAVERDQNVRVDVFDVTGRAVSTLFNSFMNTGEVQALSFDGSGLPSGIYLVRATGETFASNRMLTMLK